MKETLEQSKKYIASEVANAVISFRLHFYQRFLDEIHKRRHGFAQMHNNLYMILISY